MEGGRNINPAPDLEDVEGLASREGGEEEATDVSMIPNVGDSLMQSESLNETKEEETDDKPPGSPK